MSGEGRGLRRCGARPAARKARHPYEARPRVAPAAALRGRDQAHGVEGRAHGRAGLGRGRGGRDRREVPPETHAGGEAQGNDAPTSWGPPWRARPVGALPQLLSEPGEAVRRGKARAPLWRGAPRILPPRDGPPALPRGREGRSALEVAHTGLSDDGGAVANRASRPDPPSPRVARP